MNAVEIKIAWGDQVLFLAHRSPAERFVVGDDGIVDFAIPDLARTEIPLDRAARHEFEPVTIDVRPVELGDAPPASNALGAMPHIALSLVLHVALLGWLRSAPPPPDLETQRMLYLKVMLDHAAEREWDDNAEEYNGQIAPYDPTFSPNVDVPNEWGRRKRHYDNDDALPWIQISSGLPVWPVQQAVAHRYQQLADCWRESPLLQGWMNVGFVIGLDGSVTAVENEGSDIPYDEVRLCVLDTFRGLRFAPPPRVARVIYPVTITP